MKRDFNQPWIFFWASPDPDHYLLDQERELKRKLMVRQALMHNIISEGMLEEPPQAS
jgi:hypothetical protein